MSLYTGWLQARIQRRGWGDRGSGPPENRKDIEFVSNTVPEPLENYKATKPAFNVGPSSVSQRNVAGWPMMAHF